MSLSKTQQEFTRCVSELINFATAQGWGLTFGDAYRDKRVHGKFGVKRSYSAANSVHKMRLAVDLNLFVDDKYITDGGCEEYQLLGLAWVRMHKLARWGGQFEDGDANHFSFEYNGFK
jgi:hypothetical protein